jgi:hypothetical protein
MKIHNRITKKQAIDCWNRRDEGEDTLFYPNNFTNHWLILSVDGPEEISVYGSLQGRIIAVKFGWAHDITDML